VFDTEGKPLRGTLVEVWQANAAGRYLHRWDRWPAPLDPNFSGAGRCVTDDQGRYSFTTIKPGPYPWGNHYNAWRPAHIHFSLMGRAFAQRLVTQMYFPGDPFFPYDPIFNSVADERARERMISTFSIHDTQPNWAAAYHFDIYLRGPGTTPFEEAF
jgi:protocatechuate 3,4-dioxygenase beta subunit